MKLLCVVLNLTHHVHWVVKVIVTNSWLLKIVIHKVMVDVLPLHTRTFSEAIIVLRELRFSFFAKLFDFAFSLPR